MRRHSLVRIALAMLALVLVARCADGVHGIATANGSDQDSTGQVRVGLPF